MSTFFDPSLLSAPPRRAAVHGEDLPVFLDFIHYIICIFQKIAKNFPARRLKKFLLPFGKKTGHSGRFRGTNRHFRCFLHQIFPTSSFSVPFLFQICRFFDQSGRKTAAVAAYGKKSSTAFLRAGGAGKGLHAKPPVQKHGFPYFVLRSGEAPTFCALRKRFT